MSEDGVDRIAERNGDSRSPSVLLNGLRVLESFSITEPVLGVTEIARKVDLHKSSVSRILATLEKAGYVERDDSSGRFRLGLGLIALTGPLLANLDVRRLFERRLLVGPDEDAVDAYLDELRDSRERGFAVNDGRTSIEEVGISAPVYDHRGELVAAIMLSAPRFRVPPAMLESFGRAVADAAARVS